jgi:predicted nucleotidyltransferase
MKSPDGMNPVRERAIEQLRRIVLYALADYDAAVWLCGSCAREDVRQPDDIDVAIFPRDQLPASFFAELAAELEESAIPYYVDVLDLRNADPALLDDVLWTGIRWRD